MSDDLEIDQRNRKINNVVIVGKDEPPNAADNQDQIDKDYVCSLLSQMGGNPNQVTKVYRMGSRPSHAQIAAGSRHQNRPIKVHMADSTSKRSLMTGECARLLRGAAPPGTRPPFIRHDLTVRQRELGARARYALGVIREAENGLSGRLVLRDDNHGGLFIAHVIGRDTTPFCDPFSPATITKYGLNMKQ